MKNKLTLSIYILAYNRAESLKSQVDFFLNEIKNYSDRVELIVSDNASNDKTEYYMKQYNNVNAFRYIRNEKNYGLNGNAYLSVERVNGEYLWIIGDDPFEKGVVKRVLEIIDHNKEVNFVYLNTRPCYGKNPFGNMEYKLEEEGYYENTWRFVEDKKYAFSKLMTFTSCIIHKRETMLKTISIIPLDNNYEYSWSYFEGLISLLEGKGYFEKKVWVYDQALGVTWNEYAVIAYSSMLRSHKLLKKLEISKRQIKLMKKDCLHISPALELAFLELSNYGRYWKESLYLILYSLFLDPVYTIRMFLFN